MKILNRYNNTVFFETEDRNATLKQAVYEAIEAGLSLRFALLTGTDLRGAVLNAIHLSGADLSGADLREANLEQAELKNVNLRGANLSGASLEDADLRGANLRGAKLGDANLRCAFLVSADLRRADLQGADLQGADLRGADLRRADLRGADLQGADLTNAILQDADLRGADFRGAVLGPGLQLIGERPLCFVGPIGSEHRTFYGFVAAKGLHVLAGCFFGSREQFVEQLNREHSQDTPHAIEYRAALALMDVHHGLWSREA